MTEQEPLRQELLSAVSTALVRLFKEQLGRGPTKASAQWAGPDILVVTLEDSYTPAERSMLRLGEGGRLRELRTFFQHAAQAEFCAVVEGLTGRRVRAFTSGTDVEHDVSTEVFYLEPA